MVQNCSENSPAPRTERTYGKLGFTLEKCRGYWSFGRSGTFIVAVLFMLSVPSDLFAQCTTPITLLVPNATNWPNAAVITAPSLYPNNWPPFVSGTGTGASCAACPALFTTTVCEGQRIPIHMCSSNVYTISLCSSANTSWNSYLTITNGAGTTSYVWDDNGCGGTLSTITYNPSLSAVYNIRISGPVPTCANNVALCGTIEITCSPVPPPPLNDNPCTATSLAVGNSCSMIASGTTWATATPGIGTPPCGNYPNNADVWFTAVVPASGNLAVETNLVGATNIGMAWYTPPACNAPNPPATNWTVLDCNADIAPGSLQPYLLRTGLTPGATIYIRVWPESNILNGGSFEICAYNPVLPVNDEPCSATLITVDAACTTVNSSTQNATPSTGPTYVPAVPTCGNVAPLRDVWFTLTTPVTPMTPSVGTVINIPSANLTDAAMAVYTGTCNGTLTQVACSDPGGAALPTITLIPPAVPQGTTLYIRVWNKTTVFGTFTICAKPTSPPPNDEPCGALPLTVQYGCLFISATAGNATTTINAPPPGGTINVPNPSCGGPANNDVWFTAVVPTNGQLVLDTDDGALTNAAMEVYRVVSGTCGGGNLNLTAIGQCIIDGSQNGPDMPKLTILTGLNPTETLYIRVWRQSGAASNFQICASRTDLPPGACSYTLRMTDLGGDGWDGSTVTINRFPLGIGPPIVTNYTITGAVGSITFGGNPTDIFQFIYTPVGGFQNQIGYTVRAQNGGLLLNSGTPPSMPFFQFVVDNICNVPPAAHEDCLGAVQVCNDASLSATPQNIGAVQDLNTTNRGCLITNERKGVWYSFYISAGGQLGFSVGPGNTDYDYGVWGPYTGGIVCPPNSLHIRCSWADGAAITGLNYTATDLSEGVFGDGWTRYLDVVAGQWYTLFLDNWYLTANGFTLNWDLRMGASISCSLLPIDLLDLFATPRNDGISVDWLTSGSHDTGSYRIERSADGNTFTGIGVIEVAASASGTQAYKFLDTNPHNGTNHYRLALIDGQGTEEFSKVVTAFHGRPIAGITIRPNPVGEQLGLEFIGMSEGSGQYMILDNTGRIAASGPLFMDQGLNQRSIALPRLGAGSYTFQLQDARGQLSSARFVKE